MANHGALELANALRRDPRAWTRRALEDRWSRAAVDGALRRGTLTRVLPGIYASAAHSESFLIRAHAAHLWCGGGSVLVGRGAAAVWDLCNFPREVTIACRSGLSKQSAPDWLRIRRSDVAPVSTFWGACPVAAPAWAAVSAYTEMPTRTRDSVIYRASQRRDVDAGDLRAVVAAMPRVRGRRHLESVMNAIECGSESDLETHGLRRVFNTEPFRDLIRQHWVRTPGGRFRLDMFHPASLTAIELDGGDHGKPERRQDDITRDANVASLGILTLRFSDTDARLRREWVRDITAEVLASRS